MHPYAYCSIIYSSQNMEGPQVSMDRRMDMKDVAYTYNEIFPFATTQI